MEKIQDMNLPSVSVQKIIKYALPDGIGVAKEARIAISKAATVFGEQKKNGVIIELYRKILS